MEERREGCVEGQTLDEWTDFTLVPASFPTMVIGGKFEMIFSYLSQSKISLPKASCTLLKQVKSNQ